ncbi:uncharacterized protein BDV17DRAFT_289771 [Aspergillus undulatus]|uniref:uncharacterized protein n=1 Tax=Aspergillus undulatus TaxID=1810928 RepID=UPI003CCE281A
MTPWISYSSPSYPYPTSNTLAPATTYPSSLPGYKEASHSYVPLDVAVPATSGLELQTPNHPLDFHQNVESPRAELPIKVEGTDQETNEYTGALPHTRPAGEVIEVDGSGNVDRGSDESRVAFIPRADIVTLASLDVESISDSKVLYYFGVLATKALLLPKFEFTTSRKSRFWNVKMTIYGMTFVRSHVYESQSTARVCICREALKKLKSEFPNWVVPERPKDSISPPGWDWVEILREYCVHQGLSEPQYTKYVHHKGYRHEVEVDGGTYFGSLKHYSEELQSKQGAAHVALYDVLVRGPSEQVVSAGPPSLKKSDEAMLAVVPRDPVSDSGSLHKTRDDLLAATSWDTLRASSVPTKRRPEDFHDSRRTRRRTVKSKPPLAASQNHKPSSGNANLQPLGNCRLAAVEAIMVDEQRRWKVTPSEISKQIQDLKTWAAKLEKRPEIRIERTDGRLIEADGEYTAAAYFKNDPFLTRAGPIGQIKTFSSTKGAVHEACAWAVCDYLLDMVKEDMRLENIAAEERKAINEWGITAKK